MTGSGSLISLGGDVVHPLSREDSPVLRRLACLAILSCIACPCLAADQPAGQTLRIEPLTRGRATEVLANIDDIAEGVERQIRNPGSPRDEAILDDVRGVMAHASEWRWYSRDHGILLAIPVRERLGIGTRANAENLLADVVRRLIYQKGSGNPPVQVVFIEPEIPCPGPGRCAGTFSAVSFTGADGGAACNCR